MHHIWQNFKKAISGYPEVFKEKFIDKSLFLKIFALICSRVFGEPLKSPCVIPMADNLNHNAIDINCELINIGMHPEGEKNKDYFKYG